jgi:hypothetical protein
MVTWFSVWHALSDLVVRDVVPGKIDWFGNALHRKDVLELANDIRHGELPYLAEIEAAIDTWTITGAWPDEFSPEARFFVRARANAAADFAFLHFEPRSHETIFALPDLALREIDTSLTCESLRLARDKAGWALRPNAGP